MRNSGLTLIELIVVMVIVGVMATMVVPGFFNSTELANAKNAQNNLLAIYTAQQNYASNNQGNYCLQAGNCGNSLPRLLTNLPTLSITDDGTYAYRCRNNGTCTATRATNGFVMTVTLAAPIQLTGAVNPSCSSATWCPST